MKARENIFHTGFLVFHKGFIKEIAFCNVEYGLNFDKNAKNLNASKKSRCKPYFFRMLLSKLTHGVNLR